MNGTNDDGVSDGSFMEDYVVFPSYEDVYGNMTLSDYDWNNLDEDDVNTLYETYVNNDMMKDLDLSAYCPIADQQLRQVQFDWRGWLDKVSFRNTRAIRAAHYVPIRFGNPSDITLLWERFEQEWTDDTLFGNTTSSDSSIDTGSSFLNEFSNYGINQAGIDNSGSGRAPVNVTIPRNSYRSDYNQSDYIVGVTGTCITIFVLFVIWLVVLYLLKRRGPSKVGMWSGKFDTILKPVKKIKKDDCMEGNEKHHQNQIESNDMNGDGNVGKNVDINDTAGSRSSNSTTDTTIDYPRFQPGVGADDKLGNQETSLTSVQEEKLNQSQKLSSALMKASASLAAHGSRQASDDGERSFAQKIHNPFAVFDPFLLQHGSVEFAEQQPSKETAQTKDPKNEENQSIIKLTEEIRDEFLAKENKVINQDDETTNESSSLLTTEPTVTSKMSPPSQCSLGHQTLREEINSIDDDKVINLSEMTPESAPHTMVSSCLSTGEDDEAECNETDANVGMDDDTHTSYEQQLQQWKIHRQHQEWQLRIIQPIVILSGLCIIISSLIMAVSGVDSLVETVEKVTLLLQQVDALVYQGVDIIEGVIEIFGTAQNHTDIITKNTPIHQLLSNTEGQICGGIVVNKVCEAWARNSGVVGTQLCLSRWGNIQSFLHATYKNLFLIMTDGIQSFLVTLEGVRNDKLGLASLVEEIDSRVQSFWWAFNLARAFNLILAFLCSLILLSVCVRGSWPLLTRIVRHRIVVPIFALLVLLSFICCMVCIISSTAIADFCIDGPDQRVISLINLWEDEITDIVHEFALYYIDQCPPSLLPLQYTIYVRLAWVFVGGLFQYSEWLKLARDPIAEFCDLNNQNDVFQVAEMIQSAACKLSSLLTDTVILFQCNNWFPLYEKGVYNALCYSATSGITWIATSQIIIIFFAAVMLTFRAGFAELPTCGDANPMENETQNIVECKTDAASRKHDDKAGLSTEMKIENEGNKKSVTED